LRDRFSGLVDGSARAFVKSDAIEAMYCCFIDLGPECLATGPGLFKLQVLEQPCAKQGGTYRVCRTVTHSRNFMPRSEIENAFEFQAKNAPDV